MALPPRADEANSTWLPWLGGAALGGLLGAATMALLDPDCGPQRRMQARATAHSVLRRLRNQRSTGGPLDTAHDPRGPDAADAADTNHDAGSTPAKDGPSEEARILARVRSQLRQLCEDAQAVEVRLQAGVLELHGQVRRMEQRRVVACVRRVYGVDEVRNFLHTYERHAYVDDGRVVH